MQKLYVIVFCFGYLFFAHAAMADSYYDFNKCTQSGKSESDCYRSEARRYVKEIEAIYKKYGEDSYFDGFSVDRAQSNAEKFRKMLNLWKMYAQNYCNLISYTFIKEEDDAVDLDKCLYDMSVRHLNEIEAIDSIRDSDKF